MAAAEISCMIGGVRRRQMMLGSEKSSMAQSTLGSSTDYRSSKTRILSLMSTEPPSLSKYTISMQRPCLAIRRFSHGSPGETTPSCIYTGPSPVYRRNSEFRYSTKTSFILALEKLCCRFSVMNWRRMRWSCGRVMGVAGSSMGFSTSATVI